MNNIQDIAAELDVYTALEINGIAYDKKQRMCCPIHKGNGRNFTIHDDGKSWTCFSRHCGEPFKRDGLNLYCLLKYGTSLPKLNQVDKFKAIEEVAQVLGIKLSENVSNKSRIKIFKSLTDNEKSLLGKILSDSENLETYAKELRTPIAQRIRLFIAVAKSEKMLPAIPIMDDRFLNTLMKFIKRL